jgi:hypothetical protein
MGFSPTGTRRLGTAHRHFSHCSQQTNGPKAVFPNDLCQVPGEFGGNTAPNKCASCSTEITQTYRRKRAPRSRAIDSSKAIWKALAMRRQMINHMSTSAGRWLFILACIMPGACGARPEVTLLSCSGTDSRQLASGERSEIDSELRVDEAQHVVEEQGVTGEWHNVCAPFSRCRVEITSRSIAVAAFRQKVFGGSPVTDTLKIKIERGSGRLEETHQAMTATGEIEGNITSHMKCQKTVV